MNDFRAELEFLIGKFSGSTPKSEIVAALREVLQEIEDAEPEEEDGA